VVHLLSEFGGQKATRGLEIGSSPQYGYQQFNSNSELATLWIASDFKEQFSIDQNSLLMRLLAISNNPTVTTINLATLSPSNWAALTSHDKQIIQRKINKYTADKQTAALKTICSELNECVLQTIKLEQLNKFVLMIKKQNNLIAIYNPASNQLIDIDVFNNMMVGGFNVSN